VNTKINAQVIPHVAVHAEITKAKGTITFQNHIHGIRTLGRGILSSLGPHPQLEELATILFHVQTQ